MKADLQGRVDDASVKLRMLGSLERWFWQMGQHRPNHFVMAAEVHGTISREQWSRAGGQILARHPLLTAALRLDEHGDAYYWRSQDADLLITFKAWGPPDQWQDDVRSEMSLPIDMEKVPLMRMTVLEDAGKCMLILSFHHAVADGMSSLFIMRDLLKSLSGASLVALDIPPSQDHLIKGLNLKFTPSEDEPFVRYTYRDLDIGPPHVETAELDSQITSALLRQSRYENTTLHGAITASAVLAGRSLSDRWRSSTVRVFSPVNLRKALNVSDASVIALGVGPSSYPPNEKDTLWDLARSTRQQLRSFLTKDAPAGVQALFDFLTADNATIETVVATTAEHLGFDLMISNLQSLPFDTQFGVCSIHRVWGPSVTFNNTGEQDLGIVTVNGTLCLSYSSYKPLPGFLEAVVTQLMGAAGEVLHLPPGNATTLAP